MSTSVDLSDLKKLTVVQLKGELENRNLPTTGTKAVLIERLQADIDAHPTTSTSTTTGTPSTTGSTTTGSTVKPSTTTTAATPSTIATNGATKTTQSTTSPAAPSSTATQSQSPILSSAAPVTLPSTATDADKIAARAARFGVDTKAQLEAKKAAQTSKPTTKPSLDGALSSTRSDQKSTPAATIGKRSGSDATKLTINEDVDKIAQRAKRFATDTPDAVKPKIPVDAVQQSAEQQERLKKRAEKFGAAV